MAYENLRREIAKLGENVPGNYQTFDADRKVVVNSLLSALEWQQWAVALLTSRGREAEKADLRSQLDRTQGLDNCGGYLYQVVAVLACGPV